MKNSLALITTILALQAVKVRGFCYFPAAFQGEFDTQLIGTTSYSSLVIEPESIPIWGRCQRFIGNNVILVDDTGDVTCYKCFNLDLKSSNVLQVHTSSLDKCYTSEERAVADCPTQVSIKEKRVREIMLYRTKHIMMEPGTNPTYCPINGEYSFTYSVNDGTEDRLECESHTSQMADCPFGFGFNLQFSGCSFRDMEMSFHCLGDWKGPDGQRYVALMDTKATAPSEEPSWTNAISQYDADNRPRFRCALFKEDDETGTVTMALSSDSTCTNNLRSSTDGYETLELKPKPYPPWPVHLRYPAVGGNAGGSCTLPDWAQGKWEHLHIQEGTIMLKDTNVFKTYTARCVGQRRPVHEERFLIYSREQCGDEGYKCVWLKNRGENAIEYQVGLSTSNTHNESLCNDENFLERTWVTQGRVEVTEPTPYPIIGEYTGVIPDTEAFCAKLYSDCNNPEIMFYTIFNCFNRSQVYEEREYRCLGQWTEDHLIYTYTERRDMIGYECFVGLVTAKGDIHLKEAGSNCERGQDPLRHGMRLSQVSKCYGSRPRWVTTKRPSRTKHYQATALPTWRERELNNDVGNSFSRGSSAISLSSIIALLSTSLTLNAFLRS